MKMILKLAKLMGLSVFGTAAIITSMLMIESSSGVSASEMIKTPEVSTIKAEVKADEVVIEDAIEEIVTEEALSIIEAEEPTEVEEVVTEEQAKEESVTEGVIEELVQEVVTEAAVEEPATESVEVTENVVTEESVQEENVIEEVVEETTQAYVEPIAGVALTDEQGKKIATENAEKYAQLAQTTCDLINSYRVENGVEPLTFDVDLTYVAMHRSAENAWVECFATSVIDGKMHHVRPNGQKASSVFGVYGMYGAYAENMGRYQKSPYEIVLGEYGWKNSQTHNALMLNEAYTKVGIGIAQDSYGDYYWTAVFSK